MALRHLAPFDVSRAFVDEAWRHAAPQLGREPPAVWTQADRSAARAQAGAAVEAVARRFGVADLNRVKPGIAEATRVLLRRVPHCVLVRSPDDPDVRALLHLARGSDVPVEAAPEIAPYRAVTVIRKVV